MSQSEKMNLVDGPGATLAVARAVTEAIGVKGHYKASLMRVDEEHEEEAKTLTQLITETTVEAEVARLIGRLQALPRHEVWTDEINNVVTTVGKNLGLDTILAGSGYTAAVVMGLKGAGTAVAADTMASHGAWLEVGLANAPAYTGNRPTPSFSSAAAGVKQTSAAVAFTFTSGGTVAGCFITLAGSATKDNTTGTLLSAGDFTGGNKTVANTDVLNVTYSLAL